MKKRNHAAGKELKYENKRKNYQYRHKNTDKAEKVTKLRRAMFAKKAKTYHRKIARYNMLMKKAGAKARK